LEKPEEKKNEAALSMIQCKLLPVSEHYRNFKAANVPVKLKLQHSLPPPRAIPRAFELLQIALFKFPPHGAEKPFKCPTN